MVTVVPKMGLQAVYVNRKIKVTLLIKEIESVSK